MDEWNKLLKTPLREKKPILVKWNVPTNYTAYNNKCVPGKQYGILTGRPNNLFAIDLDVYKTNDGVKYDLDYFKKICGEDVYVIRTPSGGFHLFFEYEDKLDIFRNWNGIHGFIDIKTTKGQVVGRGSKTKKGVYTLVNGNINKLTKIPDQLYKLLEDGVAKFGYDPKTKQNKYEYNKENDVFEMSLSELEDMLEKKKEFTRFAKGKITVSNKGNLEFEVFKGQESFKLKPLSKSNAWGQLNSGQVRFKRGDLIDCHTTFGVNFL